MQRTILKPAEVHQMTGVPIETLKYWRVQGRGPRWFKLGKSVAYDLDAVNAWLDAQRETTGAQAS